MTRLLDLLEAVFAVGLHVLHWTLAGLQLLVPVTGTVAGVLQAFVFYYPLVMTYLWMTGAIYYIWQWDRHSRVDAPPALEFYPFVSILVPCHNEGDNVVEMIEWLDAQAYPNFEIIAINDGSKDDTGTQLDALLENYPRLRVVQFAANQGKAVGLRMGALAARGEFLVCIDGDALLDKFATHWMVRHLVEFPRVGAVTGNPRIRNRSSLLGKLQVGEFSAIIGMIKRAQRVYGRVFTVSGVVAAFRRRALQDVGWWSDDMITEDIDISWKLQTNFWDIRYEPNALCWILMPETLHGLWKQRLRWAQGGNEVLLRYWTTLLDWKRRRMWPVFLEYLTSVFWAYCMAAVFFLYVLGLALPLPDGFVVPTLLPGLAGMVLGLTCLMQLLLGAVIDSRYERLLVRNFYWMVWYPLAFWFINFLTAFFGLIKAARKKRGERAIWVSPDRGV